MPTSAEVRASAAGISPAWRMRPQTCAAFLDLYHAARWLPPGIWPPRPGGRRCSAGAFGDPVKIAAGAALNPARKGRRPIRRARDGSSSTRSRRMNAPARFVRAARALAASRRFLHWEAAFPGVWDEWERLRPPGGFDAVIGNPPVGPHEDAGGGVVRRAGSRHRACAEGGRSQADDCGAARQRRSGRRVL